MIPIITGVIASSIQAAPGYFTYIVYSDCDNNGSATYYSNSSELVDGAILYLEPTLTTPLLNATFYYNQFEWTSNSGLGEIMKNNPCSRTWTAYPTCNNYRDDVNSTAYYTAYDNISLIAGVVVYTDPSLATALQNSSFVYSGQIFTTDATGEIISVENCVYSLSYNTTDCLTANILTLYTSTTYTQLSELFNNSVFVYSNYSLNTPIANALIYQSSGDGTYVETNGFGQVIAVYSCAT